MELSDVVLENILESLPVGLMVIGPGGKILKANGVLSEILGYSREQLVEMGWSQFFLDGEKNTEFNQVILDVIQKEIVRLQRHVPYLDPQGETRYLDIVSSYLKEDEKLLAIVVLFDDVTEAHEQNEREKKILKQNNMIHKERLEGLNKLAMSIAHQIRNPVASIGGFAGLLMKRREKDNQEHEYLKVIKEESLKLESLVHAVKEYAQLQATNVEWLDLKKCLQRAMADVERAAEAANKEVEWGLDVQECRVLGDMALLEEAWREILLNSVEFSPASTVKIQITSKTQNNGVVTWFRDNGLGIEEKSLPYLFDPFFTSKSESSGMGMAKVKRIISEHQGNIQGYNRERGGLEIRIYLPKSSEAMEEQLRASEECL
jgi:PAS domain S-box-containing protein